MYSLCGTKELIWNKSLMLLNTTKKITTKLLRIDNVVTPIFDYRKEHKLEEKERGSDQSKPRKEISTLQNFLTLNPAVPKTLGSIIETDMKFSKKFIPAFGLYKP